MRRLWEKIVQRIVGYTNESAARSGMKFGKNCHFDLKHLGSEPYLISVGDNFKTSYNVHFVTHDGAVHVLRNLYPECADIDYFRPISIGNNVFIGANTTILAGTVIGDNVIVGAGSLVRGTLESNSVYAGVPIKRISSIGEYKDKNQPYFVHTKGLMPEEKRHFLNQLFS